MLHLRVSIVANLCSNCRSHEGWRLIYDVTMLIHLSTLSLGIWYTHDISVNEITTHGSSSKISLVVSRISRIDFGYIASSAKTVGERATLGRRRRDHGRRLLQT